VLSRSATDRTWPLTLSRAASAISLTSSTRERIWLTTDFTGLASLVDAFVSEVSEVVDVFSEDAD
jgi:hypothetical protein